MMKAQSFGLHLGTAEKAVQVFAVVAVTVSMLIIKKNFIKTPSALYKTTPGETSQQATPSPPSFTLTSRIG